MHSDESGADGRAAGCLGAGLLQRWGAGALTPAEDAACRAHAAGCGACRAAGAGALSAHRAARAEEPTPLVGPPATLGRVLTPPPLPPLPPPLLQGGTVGRYLVLEKLGQGGMGEVYAAFDPQLNRKVALKLLLPRAGAAEGPGGEQEARGRLLREAQAMAQLSHPNVLPVYDVGEAGGRVFIAMERVDGATLGRWLKAEVRPWRQVVRTLVEAGRGLAAAHRAGLVHRDFKPDNVLVGHDGRVHVMDFGLARAGGEAGAERSAGPEGLAAEESGELSLSSGLLDTPLTRLGTVIGTPGYMPPEQFRGEPLDGRADQFAFCAALYGALYGQKPFGSGSPAALMRATLAGEVRPPPRDTGVPAWVQRAVMRGLRPEREDRFPSMDALLEALLADPSARHRRRAVAAGAAALVGVLVAGRWGLQARAEARCAEEAQAPARVWGGARQAEVERAVLATGVPYAADAWRGVRAALDGYAAAWSAQAADACLATRVRGEAPEAALALRSACLQEDLGALGSLVDVLARADAAVVERAVQAAAELPALSRCAEVDALASAPRAPAGAGAAARLTGVRERLARGRALLAAGKGPEVLEAVEPALEEALALGDLPLQAEALLLRGRAESRVGKGAQAERTLRQVVVRAEEAHLDDVKLRALTWLTELLAGDTARTRETLDWADLGQAVLVRTGASSGASTAAAMAAAPLHSARGMALVNGGRYPEAEQALRTALALAERAEPGGVGAAMLGVRLGNALSWQGKHVEALAMLGQARQTLEGRLGREHPMVGGALQNLASVLSETERTEEALAAAQGALAVFEKAYPTGHPHIGYALNSVAGALSKLGRMDEALAMYGRALAAREQARGPEHPDVAVPLVNIGDVLVHQGRHREALPPLRRALALQEKGLAPGHPYVAYTLFALAGVEEHLGRPAEAAALLARAVSVREAAHAAPMLLGMTRTALARVLWDSGQDRVRARALVRQAVSELSQGVVDESLLDEARALARRTGAGEAHAARSP